MIKEVKLDFDYVGQVFESQTEYVHFLMLMHTEFDEAVERICHSIREQNLYTLRKTLHNVDAHLQMLSAEEVRSFLSQLRASLASKPLSRPQKREMEQETRILFNLLLQSLSAQIQKVQEL